MTEIPTTEVIELLETAYLAALEDLTKKVDGINAQFGGVDPISPLAMVDIHGRYILLDALTALASAHAMVEFFGRSND